MRERLIANAAMALSLVCGIGSLVLFIGFPVGLWGAVRMRLPESGVLWWDGFLSLAFFVQHSGMIRRPFRERISGAIPPRYYRAVYSVASGIVLAGVVIFWQRSTGYLLVLEGPLRWAAHTVAALAIALFVWGAFALSGLDLFGLASLRAHLGGEQQPAPVFIVRGPYRWVRHPWYLGVIMLLWAGTEVTADRLLLNVLWTAWICAGARLEEVDLRREFGADYDKYRRHVPMLVPWRGPYLTNTRS